MEAFTEGATLAVVFLAVEVMSAPAGTPFHWASNPIVGRLPAAANWLNGLPATGVFATLLALAVLLQALQSLTRFVSLVSVGYFAARCKALVTARIHSQVLSFSFPCASGYKVGISPWLLLVGALVGANGANLGWLPLEPPGAPAGTNPEAAATLQPPAPPAPERPAAPHHQLPDARHHPHPRPRQPMAGARADPDRKAVLERPVELPGAVRGPGLAPPPGSEHPAAQ